MTGHQALCQNNQMLRRLIEMRNPFIGPLNVLQAGAEPLLSNPFLTRDELPAGHKLLCSAIALMSSGGAVVFPKCSSWADTALQ